MEENYSNFSVIYNSFNILEREYLRKLHSAKQEEQTNLLTENQSDKKYTQGTMLKELEKQLPYELTSNVKSLYDDYVHLHSDSTENNLLHIENFSFFLEQIDANPEAFLKSSDRENRHEDSMVQKSYEPYVKPVLTKPITHTIDVHNAQKNWLNRYVDLGKEQVGLVKQEQAYLERNFLTRIWNRRKINDNQKYLINLTTAVEDIEWQQSNYLQNPIMITAQTELENDLAQTFIERVNDAYSSKIDQLVSTVTLENYETSTQQYNQIKSELFALEQWRFNKNASFPSFSETVERLDLLAVDVESLDKEVLDYLSLVKTASSKGETQLSDEQLTFIDSMSLSSLEQVNDVLDQCMGDYVMSISNFVKGYDKDEQIVNGAVDKIKNYSIDTDNIKNRHDQSLQKEFNKFYLSSNVREKDYLHELNSRNLEVRDNIDIPNDEDKSYIHKEKLETEYNDLSGEQVESIRHVYNRYIGSDSTILNKDTFHEYTAELNKSYNTNYVPEEMNPLEQHYTQSELDKMEEKVIDEIDNTDSPSLETDSSPSQEEIDQMEMSSSNREIQPVIDEQSTNDNLESSMSIIEKELTDALETGDMTKIAEARAKLNQQRLNQLTQHALVQKQEQLAQKELAEQQAKEQGIAIYKDYLTTGKLSDEQLRDLVSLDSSLSEHEKVSYRLEALEQVSKQAQGTSFGSYKQLLESLKSDPFLTDDFLESEYYHMSTALTMVNQQMTIQENVAELTIEQ